MSDRPFALGLTQGTLHLEPYHPDWPDLFEAEKTRIAEALPNVAFDIAHIGSTAVPGLSAKPVLDMAMAAEPAVHPAIADALTGLGWIDRGQRDGRLFIRIRQRDGTIRTHNLHLHPADAPDWHRHLAFRDALRADDALAAAYAKLKADIMVRPGMKRADYADAKGPFVAACLAAAKIG